MLLSMKIALYFQMFLDFTYINFIKYLNIVSIHLLLFLLLSLFFK